MYKVNEKKPNTPAEMSAALTDPPVPLRVLILEDMPTDAELMVRELKRAGFDCQSRTVDSEETFVSELETWQPDIILADYSLPDYSGLQALELIRNRFPAIPLIIVTGSMNEMTAVDCMKKGAADYVLKEFPARLAPAVSGALQEKQLRLEKEQAEKALQDAVRQWRTTFDALSDPICVMDQNGCIIRCNRAMKDMLGKSWQEIIGSSPCRKLHGRDGFMSGCPFRLALGTKKKETTTWKKNGRFYEVSVEPIIDDHGGFIGAVHLIADITEQKKAIENISLFRNLIDQSPDSVFIIDPEKNRIVDCNLAAGQKLGCGRDELLGLDIRELNNFFFSELCEPSALEKLRCGEIRNIVCTLSGNDGVELPVEINMKCIQQDERKFVVALARDISDRIRAEEILRQNEKQFRELYDEAPIAYFSLDCRDGSILRCNNESVSLLGYDQKNLLDMKFPALCPDSETGLKKAQKIFEHLAAGKSMFNEEIEMQRHDGKIIWTSLTVRPMLDDNGNISESRAMITDISARKILERQLLHAHKMEAIGTLAGGIAHDFNNLLSPILGYAEMVFEELDPESQNGADVKQIINGAYRAKELVSQILSFSRRDDHELRPLKPQSILKETLKLLRSTIPASIEISLEIDPHCGTIQADPSRIHQIIMNLCTNAYHAMRDKGGTMRISLAPLVIGADDVETRLKIRPGTYVRLEVSDTGLGMEPDIMERIFEPYFTTKTQEDGTGLGLFVVHGIVENMGGKITVNSEPDRGTTFQVYFPAIQQQEDFAAENLKSVYVPTGNERILVVDDEEALVQLLKYMLTSLGYQVTAGTCSEKCLATFKDRPEEFDLLITDMTMPKMTGDILAQEVVALRPGFPVLLLTGYSDQYSREKVHHPGITGFLMKPVSKKDLAAAVRQALEGSGPR